MNSKVDICNLALTHVRLGATISSLEEDSQEAIVCNQFYDIARREVLRGYKWPFATVFGTLGLVEEDSTDEWRYAYRYPVDCIKVIRIKSVTRNDSRQSRVSFKLIHDAKGLLIYTDKKSAEIEYIKDVQLAGLFPDDFAMALSFRLAYYIASRISTGDPMSLRQELIQYYEHELQKARNNASNEEQEDERPVPRYIRARNGSSGISRGELTTNKSGVSIG